MPSSPTSNVLTDHDSLAFVPRGESIDPDVDPILEPSFELEESAFNHVESKAGRRRLFILSSLVMGLCALVLAVLLSGGSKDKSQNNTETNFRETPKTSTPTLPPMTPTISPVPTIAPSTAPTSLLQTTPLYGMLKDLVGDPQSLVDPNSPQGKAFQVIYNRNETDPFLVVQRFALMVVYFTTGGEYWRWNFGWKEYAEGIDDILTDHECDWMGVSLCRFQDNNKSAVAALTFVDNNVTGEIPSEYCLLDQMEFLDLTDNTVTKIDPCITSLTTLVEVEVQGNPTLSVDNLCDSGASWGNFTADCSINCTCCTECF